MPINIIQFEGGWRIVDHAGVHKCVYPTVEAAIASLRGPDGVAFAHSLTYERIPIV